MTTKIDNIYRYLSYGLIAAGIIAIAFNPNKSQADSSTSSTLESSSTFSQSSSTRKRHKININVSSLEDVKVIEGDRVEVSSLISDRTSERTKLQAKKERLESSLVRVSLPLRELKAVPVPQFQSELTSLKKAQFNLNAIALQLKNYDQKIHHKDPHHIQVFESEKVQELANLKRQELAASIDVEQAIASLDEAKLNYQKQQYEHSRFISQHQTDMRKQQEQINSLQSQLDKVDKELESLTSVYSPYRGRIRRVKVLGQNERSINVEVTLDIKTQ